MSHTPGPWKVVEWTKGTKGKGATTSVTIEYRGLVIAECFKPTGLVERAVTNAHLIAAAPEMLMALRELGDAVDRACPAILNNRYDDTGTLGAMVARVIAKAEGLT